MLKTIELLMHDDDIKSLLNIKESLFKDIKIEDLARVFVIQKIKEWESSIELEDILKDLKDD